MLLTIAAPGAGRRLRRHPLARRDGPGRRVAGAAAGHPAPLRHALEPAAAAEQLQVQPARGCCAGSSRWAEGQMVHGSDVVITICQELQDTVAEMGAGDRALLIENVMGGDVEEPPTLTPATTSARRWQMPAAAPLVLYTGTFEAVPGARAADRGRALVAAFAPARPGARRRRRTGAGGGGARPGAEAAGRRRRDVFTGQQPAREIPAFVAACDMLASPRIRGTNTPLKIYSYLRSGKPIVATNLLTHTQVLSPAGGAAGAARARGRSPRPSAVLSIAGRRARLAAAARRSRPRATAARSTADGARRRRLPAPIRRLARAERQRGA